MRSESAPKDSEFPKNRTTDRPQHVRDVPELDPGANIASAGRTAGQIEEHLACLDKAVDLGQAAGAHVVEVAALGVGLILLELYDVEFSFSELTSRDLCADEILENSRISRSEQASFVEVLGCLIEIMVEH